ncbi:ABC transporter substrate-binding protein [Maribellus sediminis]|uniref:ABC transporter substrate-binding protein n=1 Tax=Maribellus sediminis TaxID=2696285 RepID=UPI00143011BF|nr:helical backbone metal receptor [Maribellus sediminis]
MSFKSFVVAVALLFFVLSGQARESKRVVSLAPSVSEIIYLVGAQDQLVGCTSYCTIAANDSVPVVGNAIDVNMEALFALQPDLVLAMELTKQQDISAMKKLGIKVELMKSPRNFEEICEQTLHIAGLLGKAAEAEKLVASTRQRVAEISRLAKNQKHRKIFFQLGANPIFSVLDNTFMNDYITICNGENIAAGLTKGTVTRESVLIKNPDVIIVATMGGFGEEEMKVWKTYPEIEAVKNNKVFLISSETSCNPTPTSFVSALEDVYKFVSQ